MRELVREAGLGHAIEVESAGTAGYHTGSPADARARAAAKRRGITLNGRAQQFLAKDFARFDYVLAMDGSNHADLLAIAPAGGAAKLHLLRSFDANSPRGAGVPDPYYGGPEGFDEVLDLCETACSALLERIRKERGI